MHLEVETEKNGLTYLVLYDKLNGLPGLQQPWEHAVQITRVLGTMYKSVPPKHGMFHGMYAVSKRHESVGIALCYTHEQGFVLDPLLPLPYPSLAWVVIVIVIAVLFVNVIILSGPVLFSPRCLGHNFI